MIKGLFEFLGFLVICLFVGAHSLQAQSAPLDLARRDTPLKPKKRWQTLRPEWDAPPSDYQTLIPGECGLAAGKAAVQSCDQVCFEEINNPDLLERGDYYGCMCSCLVEAEEDNCTGDQVWICTRDIGFCAIVKDLGEYFCELRDSSVQLDDTTDAGLFALDRIY